MLSSQSLEILLDLVEIKISAIVIQDKDDIREIRKLKRSRNEIFSLMRECRHKSEVKKSTMLVQQL